MDSKQTMIDGLKAILAKFAAVPPKTYKFMATVTTKDGLKISTEAAELAEGVDVFVEVDGAVQPAPDGQHTLDDGTVIEVKTGKITSITKMAATDELTEVKALVETTLAAVATDRDKFAAELTAKVAEVTKLSADHLVALAAKESEITTLKAQIQTLSSQVKSVQDGGGNKPDPKAPKLGADGRPENWNRFSQAERTQWNLENFKISNSAN